MFGWHNFFGAILLIGVGVGACALSWDTALSTMPHNDVGTKKNLWITRASTAGLVGIACAAVFLAARAHTTAWIASPWQVLGHKTQALFFIFIAGATTLLVIRAHTARLFAFLLPFILFSVNALVFPAGFGFDIFVHDATVRAWLTHGSIAPHTFLYNGFHAIVAMCAQLLHTRPLVVMMWLTPIVGAIILYELFTHAQKKSATRHLAPYLVALPILVMRDLWTTPTPQALGHFLLFGFIGLVWLDEMHTWRARVGKLSIASGIVCIHPLSGIPAIALLAWTECAHIRHTMMRRGAYVATGILTAIAPAFLLAQFSHASFSFRLTYATFAQLFSIPTVAFQPFILSHLGLVWYAAAPLAILALAYVGIRMGTASLRARTICALSCAYLGAAACLFFISLPTIAPQEQTGFAMRLLFAAYLCWIPAATYGAHTIATTVKKQTRIILLALLVCTIAASWYDAFPLWNSEMHSKAITVAPNDVTIVQTIDERAHGAPYVVLADQVTSAAALYQFGFFDRQLPDRSFYFYPIPTGDHLYQDYFLPLMYTGISREKLTHAAHDAHVKMIFVVIKPYWEPSNALIDSLIHNTTDWWTVGGAYVGRFTLE